ncbi:precorrin-4 C(11)-methyltransferase [Saccharopolyspora taberi]|uniref:Tetrapyrrole methylase domain-containing protein n=1 Tax=Saccharopolyspora taberi TaxID=60895 RepID=A0ABN3VQC6_9PSEU
MIPETHPGRVSFVGAGPGAADLITVRGARRIAEADIVVWTASLVAPECVQEHARQDAELVDSSRLTHEEAVEIYRRAERDRLRVARVHAGDPALWGAVQEQYDACTRMELEVEIVPGVGTFSAAAAAAGRELTVPEVAQSVVLTRLEGGQPPMPERERVREFARHGTTMAVLLSAARAGQLADELRAGGYTDDVPVLIAHKVSWPDELLVRTTIGELAQAVKQHRLWRNALFIVGRALQETTRRGRNYPAGHFHAYRRPEVVRRSAKDGAKPDQPGSDVAWWAVRSWQETARGGRAKPAPAPQPGAEQPDLFVDAEEIAVPAQQTEEVAPPPNTTEAPQQAPVPQAAPRQAAEAPAQQAEQAPAQQPAPHQAEQAPAQQPAPQQAEQAPAQQAEEPAPKPRRAATSAARRTGTEQATAKAPVKSRAKAKTTKSTTAKTTQAKRKTASDKKSTS